MGFMDKAKQMADQAQKKLDEVQSNINQGQQQGPQQDQGAQKFDAHGRPIQVDPQAQPATPAQPEPEQTTDEPQPPPPPPPEGVNQTPDPFKPLQ